ncbi:hypothetical protein XENORESO_016883, partial [Xenotaenia resolanae]
LNADCLDDLPLDYDLALGGVGGVGMGGVGALALEAVVSGASSDGTLSEGGSSVVLDPGVRRVGLPQDYQDLDPLRDSPITATTDTHTGELQPMASSASVASLVIAVETGLSDEESIEQMGAKLHLVPSQMTQFTSASVSSVSRTESLAQTVFLTESSPLSRLWLNLLQTSLLSPEWDWKFSLKHLLWFSFMMSSVVSGSSLEYLESPGKPHSDTVSLFWSWFLGSWTSGLACCSSEVFKRTLRLLGVDPAVLLQY